MLLPAGVGVNVVAPRLPRFRGAQKGTAALQDGAAISFGETYSQQVAADLVAVRCDPAHPAARSMLSGGGATRQNTQKTCRSEGG
jgi:hypothetical protein